MSTRIILVVDQEEWQYQTRIPESSRMIYFLPLIMKEYSFIIIISSSKLLLFMKRSLNNFAFERNVRKKGNRLFMIFVLSVVAGMPPPLHLFPSFSLNERTNNKVE